jgi:alpha/beta superfamily hydrolase
VRAALDWLDREFHRPILFAGFSFGASIGLRACCGDGRVKGLIALGLPVHAEGRDYHYRFLPACTQPKLFISGSRDQYGPKPQVEAIVQTAPQPAELVWVDDAEHFFAGKLDQVQLAIRNWVQAHFLPADAS